MQKRSLLKKAFSFSINTMLSRVLGAVREALQIKYLGVGIISDAFLAAFKAPYFFRQVFAEGALSAALIPTLVQLERKNDTKTVNGLVSLCFIIFEGIVVLLCLAFIWKAEFFLRYMIAPGFSQERLDAAIPLLRIMFPLLLFISSSAILGGALQSINHFFIPAFGPAFFNMIHITALVLCIFYQKPPTWLAMGVVTAGVLNFLLHLAAYLKYRFTFGPITPAVKSAFRTVMKKFFPCFFGIGIVEINLFLDSYIASFLPVAGSYSLLYYANRFMNFPLGIFAVALSTVLLPHFARVASFAPKRLNFYLLEVTKLVSWIIIPSTLFIFFTADKLFYLLMKNPSNIREASWLLIIYSSGLIFFCINKVFVTTFYAMHDTVSPTIGSVIATVVNFLGNVIGLYFFGSYGIAAATAISGLTLTIVCFVFFHTKHKFSFYFGNYFLFLGRYAIQLALGTGFFILAHKAICSLFIKTSYETFFCMKWGYWMFTIPLFLFTMVLIFCSKDFFKLKLYFLNK